MLEDTIKSFGSVPARLLNSHKGSYGKLLILAGSPGMCGAAALVRGRPIGAGRDL